MSLAVFKAEPTKPSAEAASAGSSVLDSSAKFTDPTAEVFIVKNEIVRAGILEDFGNPESKDHCAQSALQPVKELC